MPKNNFVDFKFIKANLTMEKVLEHYNLLRTFKRSSNGENVCGPCPIHKGTNPSQFRVSLTKNVWNCFSECKHGGNALDFIARMESISIHAAALKAQEWFGISPPGKSETAKVEIPEPRERPQSMHEPDSPNPPLKFRLEKLVRDHSYLAERGLTLETVINFGIGHCQKGSMKGHIAIPIHNVHGEVVAYAGRWPGDPPQETPKYKLPAGFHKSQELFNIDRAIKEPPGKPLVIVEGFFDCMKLWQLGFKKVVALMGSTLSPAQEQLIRKHIHPSDQILVMLDEDEAGRAARDDIASRLAKFSFVKVHTFVKEGTQPEHLNPEEASRIFGFRELKFYEGIRVGGSAQVTANGQPLDPRLDLHNHSPTGFDWGYSGSGPAQLALALLADHLADNERALSLYQPFKFAVISRLPKEGWKLTSSEIDEALKSLKEVQT